MQRHRKRPLCVPDMCTRLRMWYLANIVVFMDSKYKNLLRSTLLENAVPTTLLCPITMTEYKRAMLQQQITDYDNFYERRKFIQDYMTEIWQSYDKHKYSEICTEFLDLLGE